MAILVLEGVAHPHNVNIYTIKNAILFLGCGGKNALNISINRISLKSIMKWQYG